MRCIDATALARPALALPTRNWPCPRPATCTALLGLAGCSSQLHRTAAANAARRGLVRPPRYSTSTLGTCAASVPQCLHVRRWSYPPETGLAQGQPTAAERSGWRCPSGAAPSSQGPDENTWDVRCIDERLALALTTRNWLCIRSVTSTASLGQAVRVSQLHRKAATGPGRRGLLGAPMEPTSTLGTCAASVPRRLNVRGWPYPPETGLPQGRPFALHL